MFVCNWSCRTVKIFSAPYSWGGLAAFGGGFEWAIVPRHPIGTDWIQQLPKQHGEWHMYSTTYLPRWSS